MLKLVTSSNPDYSLVCPSELKDFPVFILMINTVANILNLRVPGKSYTVNNPKHKVYIVETDKKKIFLGYDNNLSLWHTSYKINGGINKFLQKLSPLNETELTKVTPETRYPPQTQLLAITFLQSLCFAPPAFYLQHSDPRACLSLPKSPVQTKNISNTSKESMPQFFTTLLSGNKGLFLGHCHSALKDGLADLLVALMGTFATAGVKHLYEEVPATTSYPLFENFNLNKEDNGEDLEKYLGEQRALYIAERLKIYKAAKSLGIQVWPIDTTYRSPSLAERMQIGNGTMIYNTDYYAAALKKEEKYLSLLGAAHYSVAEALGVPNVFIDDVAPKTECDEMNLSFATQTDSAEFEKIFESAPDFIVRFASGFPQDQFEITKPAGN